MRRHAVNCQIENEIRIEHIQYKTNKYIIIHIKERINGNGLTKEEKLTIIDTLLANLKSKNIN